MATLPVIGARPTPTPSVNVTSDQSGEIIAGAVGQLGQVAVKAASQFNDAETARNKTLSVLQLAKTTNALHDAHDDVARRVLDSSLLPEQAGTEFTAISDKIKTEMLGTLKDQAQRDTVDAHLTGLTGSLGRSLGGVVIKRRQQETASFIDQYMEEQSRAAVRDGAGLASERVGAILDFAGGAANLNPQQQAKIKQSFSERTHASYFSSAGEAALENGDASALQTLRNHLAGPPGEALDPDKRTQLSHQFFTWGKQIEGQRGRERDAADRIAADTIKTLEKFADEGRAPDPTYQQQIRLQTRGTAWEKQAEELITSAQAGAALGSMPIPRQAEIVAQLESSAGNPSDVVQAKRARRILDTQRAAYKDDMWDAAARFQRGMPILQTQNITDAGQLLQIAQDRVPLMPNLEAATGLAAELLRPAEVSKAILALQSKPIAERSVILANIGAALKDPRRIEAFAEQVGKSDDSLALSMKFGDMTTAGRALGELIQTGAQAIRDKTVKMDDTAISGWRASIAPLVDGTLSDPKAEKELKDAAFYIRAAQDLTSAKAPNFTGGFGSGEKDALTLLIGRPLDRGGVKTFLPRGMNESQFDAKAREVLAAGAGQTVYSRGEPVTVEALALRLSAYGMRMVRPGEYMPIVNNAPFTVDKEGRQPLRLRVQ